MNQFIQSWLLESFVIFLIVGSLFGMAIGALLVLRPQSLLRAGQLFNRWVSTRHLDRSLERTVQIDPWFYRYRRASSTLTLLGACYVVYFFTVNIDRADVINELSRQFNYPSAFVAWLLDALVLSALLGALFAAFVSLSLLLRPSMLRDFEEGANRWLSLRRGLKPMEIPRQNVDEFVLQHGRQAGILLVLGSLYTVVLLTVWFSHFHGA
jgi:hypothetical protein